MGEILEVGHEVKNFKVGDRVIIPFTISDGTCWHCAHGYYSACETTNPNNKDLIKLYGYPGAALYGYSHLYGGIPGGQAEYVRVLLADRNAFKVPDSLSDEQALFVTDIFPTGYMAAENANVQPQGTVAIWGAGPVGQFAMKSAFLLGAARVIMIDRVPERLELAKHHGAEVLNYEEEKDVPEKLKDLTNGRGPDACIDAVGLEAHAPGFEGMYDRVKQTLKLETDRPAALREAIRSAKPGSTLSIPGVYMGFIDTFPFGVAFGKGLTFKMGQTHVHAYAQKLLKFIEDGKIDPTFLISHRLSLDEAPKAYEIFRDKKDHCTKVVFTP